MALFLAAIIAGCIVFGLVVATLLLVAGVLKVLRHFNLIPQDTDMEQQEQDNPQRAALANALRDIATRSRADTSPFAKHAIPAQLFKEMQAALQAGVDLDIVDSDAVTRVFDEFTSTRPASAENFAQAAELVADVVDGKDVVVTAAPPRSIAEQKKDIADRLRSIAQWLAPLPEHSPQGHSAIDDATALEDQAIDAGFISADEVDALAKQDATNAGYITFLGLLADRIEQGAGQGAVQAPTSPVSNYALVEGGSSNTLVLKSTYATAMRQLAQTAREQGPKAVAGRAGILAAQAVREGLLSDADATATGKVPFADFLDGLAAKIEATDALAPAAALVA